MDRKAWRVYGPLGRKKSDMTVATEHACMSIIKKLK